MTNICIGIQARSTSTRFPGKVLERIGYKTVLERVVDSANSSSRYINRGTMKSALSTSVYVLTPHGDKVAEFCKAKRINCMEGDEFDVLSRYKKMADLFDCAYVVRLTADCPFVPAAYISKTINTAVKNNMDYCSNVDPRFRTSPDGFDVEVISRRAIQWLDTNATEKSDREHVTTKIRTRDKPSLFSVGVVLGHIDLSGIKLSIDTEDDLRRGIDHFETLDKKISVAREVYGDKSIHRF
jgi:glutamate-1-semialdehyde 2,1-aminomutase